MSRRRRAVAGSATVTGIAAAFAAGYAAAGATGVIDVAALTTLGVLIVARGAVRGPRPRSVLPGKQWRGPGRRPAVRAEDFPAYASIASEVEWARMSQRHYEHGLRPRLARLAASLGKPAPPQITGTAEEDGPGPDLATLERIVTHLEAP